jgi:hypothetical protein
MPQSIPHGLTREAVMKALADLDASVENPFGSPTGYELVHEGKRYPPKAVVGLAFKYVHGSILQPGDFSGGEAPGQANYVLRELGFTVVKKGEKVEEQETAGKDWSDKEVEGIVADYLQMLEKELLGKEYSKSEHRKVLSPNLPGRSKGSIEFKHQNISAVLVNLGLPYIEGYKPRGNFQGLLGEKVEAFLDRNPSLLERFAGSQVINPTKPPDFKKMKLDQIREQPPDQIILPKASAKPWLSRKGRKINFAERDAANRQLGKQGEEFVIWFEQQRLVALGRDDLAKKVKWMSETIGDGLGFDVLSFEEADDSEKLVEVKTTGLGKFFPFFATDTEVRCSEDVREQFHLFRVFDFGRQPRLYVVQGSLRDVCQLEAVVYRVGV